MKQIMINEWKYMVRTPVFLTLSLFVGLSLFTVTLMAVKQNHRQTKMQQEAKAHIRDQWEALDEMHPHMATHFGSYVFKPNAALSSLDEGINAVTGNVLRLEAHFQHEMAYSEASQSLSMSKFGTLNAALILQFIIPLFLIFLAFSSVSQEKETGRIRLLVLQGTPIPQLIMAKALSIWVYGLSLLVFTLLIQLVLNSTAFSSDYFLRIFFLFVIYMAYYYIVTAFTVYLSARLKNNTAALTTALACWLLWCVFLPKLWGSTVEEMYPLPSRQDFKTAMADDRSKGLDGHNPEDKRRKAFEIKTLHAYGVDNVEDLPINFDGLLMQRDEEYGYKVWDKHFGHNYTQLKKQKKAYQYAGFVNPFAALHDGSMGFSGSDMIHYVDFQLQAEHYRRMLLKKLNDKQTYGGSKTGDWEWKEKNAFYKSIPDFNYRFPKISPLIPYYGINLISLLFWAIITTVFIGWDTKKIRL